MTLFVTDMTYMYRESFFLCLSIIYISLPFGWFFAKCPLFTSVEVNLSIQKLCKMSYPSHKINRDGNDRYGYMTA